MTPPDLETLVRRYLQLRRVTGSLTTVGEETARAHVLWLLRAEGEVEERR